MHITKNNKIQAVILVALSMFALWGAWIVPHNSNETDTWAGSMPFGASAGMLVLSVLLLIKSFVGQTAQNADDKSLNTHPSVIGLLLLSIAYYLLIIWFGYILSTAVMAPIILYAFKVRNRLGLAMSSIICPAVFYMIFFVGLAVYPPYGEVFDIMDWIQG